MTAVLLAMVLGAGLPDSPIDVDCGLTSLYTVMRWKGIDVDLASLRHALPASRDDRTSSLRDLIEAGRTLGFGLSGRKLAKSDRIDRPMAIYLDRKPIGHFVAARPVGHTGRLIQIVDDPDEPLIVDELSFRASPEWTGIAIIPRPSIAGYVLGSAALGCLVVPLIRRLGRNRSSSPQSQ